MKYSKDKMISIELMEWFQANKENKDKWNKTFIGKVIKDNLILEGKWKRGENKKNKNKILEKSSDYPQEKVEKSPSKEKELDISSICAAIVNFPSKNAPEEIKEEKPIKKYDINNLPKEMTDFQDNLIKEKEKEKEDPLYWWDDIVVTKKFPGK